MRMKCAGVFNRKERIAEHETLERDLLSMESLYCILSQLTVLYTIYRNLNSFY